jgi:hypothetical protein
MKSLRFVRHPPHHRPAVFQAPTLSTEAAGPMQRRNLCKRPMSELGQRTKAVERQPVEAGPTV